MVIGFDGSRAFIPGRTGTENYSYQLLKALAKIDKKNTYRVYLRPDTTTFVIARPQSGEAIFSDQDCHVGRRLPPRNDRDSWPGNFHFKTINWPRLWTQGGLAQQTFKDKLDVLFVPAHTLPVIRKPGLKTVVTVHDLGSEYLPGMHQVKQRLYLGFMQRYQLKSATQIIAVSKATKEDLVKKIGIDSKKIKVVYEGYDKQLFRPIKGDLLVNSLKEYDLEPGKYFLFVGTVQPRKNLERLIKAFAKWFCSFDVRFGRQSRSLARQRKRPAVRYKSDLGYARFTRLGLAAFGNSLPLLVIVGSKGWLSDEIYELPKKLGVEDRVKFLGYVPDQDLPVLYSGAVALTFPSLFEGFGLPILEAEACGCPVLTSNTSSMPEVAGPATTGGAIYVDPYSIDDIVEGMERLQATGIRQQLVKKGSENVKRFSWEKCARETLEVLERL